MKDALKQIKKIAEEFHMSVVVMTDEENEGQVAGIMIGYPEYVTWMLGDAAHLHEELATLKREVN